MTTPTVTQVVQNAVVTAGQTQAQIANQIGHGITMDKLREVDSIRQQGEIDRLRSEANRPAPLPPSSRASPETLHEMARQKEEMARQKANFEKTLAQKDALILEWMHSNDSFKRLARKYGKELKVSDEQLDDDFNEAIVDIAEENPKFESTALGGRAKAWAAGAKS